MRTRACALIFAAAAVTGWAGSAEAQLPEGPYVMAQGHVTLAAELSATASPRDDVAFFNYTDYEHDALRTVRGRLLGEWRIVNQVTVLGELRAENRDSLEAAALYVRWRPWSKRAFDVQVGRIPPVVGAFARRAYGRDNLVIGIPLAYQYLTSLRSDALPSSADDVLRMRARGWRSSFPIGSTVPGPGTSLLTPFRWSTGGEVHWQSSRVDLAGALTNGALATPGVFEADTGLAWSGRVAVTPAAGLTLGFSGARGAWIHDEVLSTIAESKRSQNLQTLLVADAEFGLGRWLVRGEYLRSAFQLPVLASPVLASPLVARSGFAEARYRWHPRWQSAVRVEHLTFNEIHGTLLSGAMTAWDAPLKRIEAIVGYRAARNLELRAGWQYNKRRAGRVTTRGVPEMQVLYWF